MWVVEAGYICQCIVCKTYMDKIVRHLPATESHLDKPKGNYIPVLAIHNCPEAF